MDIVRRCPNCKSNQATYPVTERGSTVLRCRTCGFPVERKLPEDPAAVPGKGTVLCVDDDPVMLHLLASTLQKKGFHPVTAHDGMAGIEAARRDRPILILLDIEMPGLDGFEVCRRLRADAQTNGIPVIILTSSADPHLNVQAFKAGADLALTKPFDAERLMATLQAALALKHK